MPSQKDLLYTIAISACASFLSNAVAAPITNPLMPDSLIFITRDVCPAERSGVIGAEHIVDQYFGFNACDSGGLYLMTGARSGAPMVRDILASATVQNGRLAGRALTGGGFLSPDLSYDAKTVVFAWVERPASGEGWAQDQCFHIFKVNVDGTGLMQLTDGTYNDFDPCFLPGGRIVFVSERRGGYGRCHPRTDPTYTMYSMKDDGSDMVPISYHETNEWQPSVNNDGMIVYTRWDYLDRDDCIAHHLWTCYPDGRDPRAPHGNYPLPLTTMTGSNWQDGRWARPNCEMNIRAIPNSVKYVAIGAGHHRQAYGDVLLIDPTIPDNGAASQITRVTNETGSWGDFYQPAPWGTPWPLSEEYFLATRYSTIELLRSDGTSQTVYTAAFGRPLDPIPLRPRTSPPVLATGTWQGERAALSGHKRATISVMNVNYGDLPLPAGTVIKELRILQVIPQATPLINQTRIGYASESLARLCLGTVPVEPDGSAYFEAPVGKEIYFQLLDEKGMAVQSMRAGTYVHPGEQLTCYGCHEDKWKATPAANPIATRRAPSPLVPEAGAESNGVTPINFSRLVKPIFAAKCTPCHTQQGKGPAGTYASFQNYAFWWPGPGNPYVNGDIVTPKHGGSRTMPGLCGARVAPLTSHLDSSHHGVSLTPTEIRRITLWLDGNSNEFSAYTKVTEQRAGQLVWPELDFDSLNPTGVESSYPSPAESISGTGGWRPARSAPGASVSLIVRGRTLELENPCAGPARVRVCDAAGRVVADRAVDGPRAAIALPSSGVVYVVTVRGADGRTIVAARAVSSRSP